MPFRPLSQKEAIAPIAAVTPTIQPPTVQPPPETSFLKEAFPATTAAEGVVGTTGGVLSDILTGTFRLPAAVGREIETTEGPDILKKIGIGDEPREQSFTESLRQINQGLDPQGQPETGISGFLNELATDPRTAPGLLVGGAAGNIKKGAPLLQKLLQLGKFGVAEGAATAAAGQAESLAETGELDPTGAAVDFAVPALGTPALGGLGELLKKGGGGLLQKIIKPTEKIGRQEEKIGKNVGQIIQEEGLQSITGGLKGIADNAQEATRKASNTLDELLKNSNETFSVGQAVAKVKAHFNSQLVDLKDLDTFDAVIRAQKKWDDVLTRAAPTGEITAKQARNLVQSLSDQAGFQGVQATQELKGEAQYARALWAELRREMGERIPGVNSLNRIMNEAIPVFEAAERGARRTGKRDIFSLPVLLAGSLGFDFLPAAAQGRTLAGGLVLGSSILSRSPRAASSLISAGQGVQNVAPVIRRISNPAIDEEVRKLQGKQEALERAVVQ